MKSKIILPRVYLLTYKTRYELCMSFVRMQEFYESPKFKGKWFSLEDFMDYWSLKHGEGSFTYPIVWNGFNLPSEAFNNWCDMFQDSRRPRENIIIEKIDKLRTSDFAKNKVKYTEKYYIIAAHEEKGDDKLEHIINHEVAHAIYYLYPEYKNSCDELLKKISKKDYNNDKKTLLDMGYSKSVINDELQAYYSDINGVLNSNVDFIENLNDFKKKIS